MRGQAGLRETLLLCGAALPARHQEMLGRGWRRRLPALALVAAAVALYAFGLVVLDISPARIAGGAGRLFDIARLMLPPDPQSWARAQLYLGALGQTLAIAFLGTLGAAVLGCPFGFLAARNVVANRLLHLLARRSLDTVRSIDTLIWALIWINVVGLGPFAGALAIMTSDFAALGKLTSEAIEAADPKPVDGVLSSAAANCTLSASAYCRRCCRSSPAKSSISSSRIRARLRSSASSVPVASASNSPSRSACSNGSRSPF